MVRTISRKEYHWRKYFIRLDVVQGRNRVNKIEIMSVVRVPVIGRPCFSDSKIRKLDIPIEYPSRL